MVFRSHQDKPISPFSHTNLLHDGSEYSSHPPIITGDTVSQNINFPGISISYRRRPSIVEVVIEILQGRAEILDIFPH